MKTALVLMTVLVSVSAFASTYSDRQTNLNQQSDAKVYANEQKYRAQITQKFLRLLAGFVSRHGGAKTAVACQTDEVRSPYRSRDEGVGSTVLSGGGLTISLEYTASDLQARVHNQETGRLFSVPVQPYPDFCAFDLRDGLGCEAYTERADLPNDEFGTNLMVRCISASYKKIEKNLGRID